MSRQELLIENDNKVHQQIPSQTLYPAIHCQNRQLTFLITFIQ